MDFTLEAHTIAGLGALGLGAAALMRRPSHPRNLIFALLCGALSLWNLGYAVRLVAGPDRTLESLYLAGSCASAPLGLHVALVLTGYRSSVISRIVWPAYGLAAALWSSIWTPAYADRRQWNLGALVVIGSILFAALVPLWVHAIRLRPGPERRAYRLLAGGAIAAVAGGLSDFLPRTLFGFPKIGPILLLGFLLVVCALVIRDRFLDINRFLAGSVMLLILAVAFTTAIYLVLRLTGPGFLPLLIAVGLVLALIAPLVGHLVAGGRSLFSSSHPFVEELLFLSRTIQHATDAEAIWAAVSAAGSRLPEPPRLSVYLRGGGPGRLRSVHPEGAASPEEAGLVGSPRSLVQWLEKERAPLTRMYLSVETRSLDRKRRELAADLAERLSAAGVELVIPLIGRNRLAGLIMVGGGSPDIYLRPEVAAALMAIGSQAVAILERQEAMERARHSESLAAIGELAAGLAHEVRNPAAAIRGAAQVLMGESGTPRAEEMLQVLEEETDRLGRVVGEFLDFARQEEPRLQSVPVHDLLLRSLRSVEASGSGLGSELRVAPGTPAVRGDPEQLQRVFVNLIRNAREAAGENGHLLIEACSPEGGGVTVRFSDDGPGIAQEEVSRIFRPFHTTKPSGTGLGLSIVQKIVHRHHGEIRVEGSPGRGAIFTLTLPSAEESM